MSDHSFRREVDEICAEFEERWSAETPPDFRSWLARISEPHRLTLLRHLLAIDVEFREQAGQTIAPSDYRALGPDAMAEVERLVADGDRTHLRERESLTSSSPEVDEQHRAEGVRFVGPYRLIQPIGEGGMGTVYLAEQKAPVARQVALKLIKSATGSSEILTRFEAERQAMAIMNHPNIARILDAGTTADGQPYFAMELVEGEPITTYCDRHQSSIEERLNLFCDVCLGVQHAHQKGIIHRDLKPSNILVSVVDGKPVPKVIDFGLAKAMDSTQRLTDHSLFTGIGQVLGTLKYMSPEQAALDSVDIDTRTDIYALGVILYELLTGHTPLDSATLKGEALFRILDLIRDLDPAKPSSRLSDSDHDTLSELTHRRRTDSRHLQQILAGDLDWIVMKALEKDRNRRYDSASGFADDVQRFLADEPVEARPPSLNYKVRKFVKKNRGSVLAASLVLLALIAGIIGTSWGMWRALDAEATAEQRRTEAEDALARETIALSRESEQRQIAESRRQEAETARTDAEEALARESAALAMESEQRKLAEERQILAETARADAEVRRQQTEKYLDFARESNKILASIFADLDPDAAYSTVAELRNALADGLEKAIEALNGLTEGNELDVAQMLHLVATSLHGLGRDDRAVEAFEQALELRSEALGANHETTLETLGNLAVAVHATGDLKRAIALHEQALKGLRETLGPDHPSAIASLGNLASLYNSLGEVERALELNEEALRVSENSLGENHPNSLAIRNNLAQSCYAAGRYQDALDLHLKTLDAAKATFGENHPNTLTIMNNVALAYRALGQFDRAIELYEQTLALALEILGPTHPATIDGQANLAEAYGSSGQIRKAIPLYEKALELQQTILGADHPATLNTMGNLAMTYQEAGDLDKALPLHERTWELKKEKLGENHPLTLLSMSNLASGYRAVGELDKAVAMAESVVQRMTVHVGPDHPNTLTAMNNLAICYGMQKDLDKAIPLLEKVIDLQSRTLGEEHPDTLTSLQGLAAAFRASGQPQKAIPLAQKALKIFERELGRDNYRTKEAALVLGVILQDAGQVQDAIPLLEEALRASEQMPNLKMARARLRRAYVSTKQVEKYKPLAAVELESARESLPERSPELANVLVGLGRESLAVGDPEAAVDRITEGWQIRKEIAPEDWSTFEAQSLLGAAYLENASPEQARPLLVEGFEGLKEHRASIPAEIRLRKLVEAVDRLIEFHQQFGETDAAAKWAAEKEKLTVDEAATDVSS